MKTIQSTNPIQVIYAGGTFGCHGSPLQALSAKIFIPSLQALCQDFDIQILDNSIVKDSSTLTANDFIHFYQLIVQAHKEGADKFVLITGTDTLAYLAAFLSIGLQPLNLSLVITGSMLPLFEPNSSPLSLDKDSDAWHNLSLGLNFLKEAPKGSFVSFFGQIYYADSVQKIHRNAKDAFSGTVFGQDYQELPRLASYDIRFFDSDIYSFYCLPNTPALMADFFEQLLDKAPSAIIVLGFGAGNMPACERLKHAIENLHKKGHLLIMSSSALYGQISADYEAGAWQYSLGFVSGHHLSISALYAYALWICLTTPTHERKYAWQKLEANL